MIVYLIPSEILHFQIISLGSLTVKNLGCVPKESEDHEVVDDSQVSPGCLQIFSWLLCPLVKREWALYSHRSGFTSGSSLVISGDPHMVSEPQSPHLDIVCSKD